MRTCMEDYELFCQQKYLDIYAKTFSSLRDDYINRHNGSLPSDKKEAEFETSSQKEAMKQTFVEAILEYPHMNPSPIWRAVRVAHMYRKSRISDLSIIENVISADQSWKKSSGHAFEEVIKDYCNVALSGTNVEIVLQRDLTILISEHQLDNEEEDYDWL